MSLIIKIGLITAGALGLCLASTAERELGRQITQADCRRDANMSIDPGIGAHVLCQLERAVDGRGR
jgi:hypothetical protein